MTEASYIGDGVGKGERRGRARKGRGGEGEM